MRKMLKACLGCGRGYPPKALALGRCPRCLAREPRLLVRAVTGRWSPDRLPAEHQRFARAVRARAGNQCEAIEGGVRCPVTTGLQAHHLTLGYEAENGVLLCERHHRMIDPHARKGRR